MKKYLPVVLLSFFLLSCSNLNKLILNDDPYKNQKSLKMMQALYGVSNERAGINLYSYDYTFSVKYTYVAESKDDSFVRMELKLTTPVRPELLDSTIYLVINDEAVELKSEKFDLINFNRATSETTYTTETKDNNSDSNSTDAQKSETVTTSSTTVSNSSYQTVQHSFIIPKDLYSKLVFFQKIKMRAYIGDEGVDIRFNWADQTALRKYFKKVFTLERN